MFDCYNRRINYLRISVTDRCNLRCRYCMPDKKTTPLSYDQILSFEEITAFVKLAAEAGINKVRLTGGEPLVRKDIAALVSMLAGIKGIQDLAMSTNGLLLAKFAATLKNAGLHRLNISLDTVNKQKFANLTRGGKLEDVLAGISAARKAGFDNIKINCVIQTSPEEEDAVNVAKFAAEHALEIRYIRKMTMDKGEFWQVIGGIGGNCSLCNRIRLSCDGWIYPCLFSEKRYSIHKLGPIQALQHAVANKPEAGTGSANNRFYRIGG